MPKRVCDSCGEKKSVRHGKTCENGHFVCRQCIDSGGGLLSYRKKCPLCGKPLR